MFAEEILQPSQAIGNTSAQGNGGAGAKASAPNTSAGMQSIAVGLVWLGGALLAMLIGRAASE
jgi:hypothetical protein